MKIMANGDLGGAVTPLAMAPAIQLSGERSARALSMIADPRIKVISFDVFDTLLVRRFGDPKDLFRYIEKDKGITSALRGVDFAKLRILAERQIREEYKAQALLRDPTIDDIYDRLGVIAELDIDQKQAVKEFELKAELKFARQRLAAKVLYDAALAFKKRVVICSDMYLPPEAIQEMLRQCGYTEHTDLFVSSVEGGTKKHGSIFKLITDKLGVEPGEVFHLGDNSRSDVVNAERAGWNAFKMPSIDELMFAPQSHAAGIVAPKVNSIRKIPAEATRHNYAIVADGIFGKSFSDECASLTPYEFGFSSLGPFLLSLALWVRRHCIEKDISRVYWLARDGYLPKEATDLVDAALDRQFESSYLPISRRSLFPYFIHKPGGLEKVLGIRYRPDLTIEQFITERFGETGMQLFRRRVGDDADEMLFLLMKDNHDYICGLFRENLEYLREHTLAQCEAIERFYQARLKGEGRAAVFDVGRKGTFQSVLSSISNTQLYGFYVVNDYEIHKHALGRNFESFLGIIDPIVRRKNPDTIIYEALLSEREPSFIGLDADENPIRAPRNECDSNHDSYFEQVHRGALDFVKEAITTHGERIEELEQDSAYAAYSLENWQENSAVSALLSSAIHDDPISAGTNQSIAAYAGQSKVVDPRFILPPKSGRQRIMIYCPAVTRIRGGAERITVRVANYLRSRGYDVLVFSAGNPQGSQVPVYEVAPGVIVRNINLRDIGDIEQLVAAYSPDAGLILASGPATINVSLAFLRKEVPYMMSERASPVESMKAYWGKYSQEDYFSVYEAASSISVQFESFKEAFPENMRDRIMVLPNPIELSNFDDVVREKTILCIGRIWFTQKRQDILLDAFSKIAPMFTDWKLKFYGSVYGNDGKRLEDRIRELGLSEQVEVHDSVPQIADEMKRASFVVMPSSFEGFPNALAEALALGTPAIGFESCPGVNQLIIDKVNGLLVPDEDIISILETSKNERARMFALSQMSDRLSQAIETMITDAEFRFSASRAAKIKIAPYGEDKVLDYWRSAIDQLLNLSGSIYKRQRVRTLLELSSSRGEVAVKEDTHHPLQPDTLALDRSSIVEYLKQQRLPIFTRIKFALRRLMLQTDSQYEERLLEGLLAPRGQVIVPVPEEFSEDYYLENNPDVAIAVQNGELQSGYIHYVLNGADEGRPAKAVTSN